MLEQHNVVAVHLGPPCGTSSRARDIRRRSGPDPKPLRSEKWPNGLPHLVGKDLLRVKSANQLYDITAKIYKYCCANGILATVENPARSFMWLTDPFINIPKCNLKYSAVFITACLVANVEKLPSSSQIFPKFQSWRCCVITTMNTLDGEGQMDAGQLQPKLNTLWVYAVRVQRFWWMFWGKFQWPLQDSLNVVSCRLVLRRLALKLSGEKGERAEVTIGIQWEPAEFIQRAAGLGHPKHFLKSIPREMEEAICTISSMSAQEVGRTRTEVARKWLSRSLELREKECEKHDMEAHCKEVLAKKNLTIFSEVIESSGYEDVNIAKDIERGFDLMGHLPSCGVFHKCSSFASLMPEHVRNVSEQTNPCCNMEFY